MFPLYMWWAWDFCQCARGIHDTTGPFGDLSLKLKERAGQKMKIVLALVDICGDMSAWVEFSGLRTWSHHMHPCGSCNFTLLQIRDPSQVRCVSSDEGPWKDYTDADYLEDVKAHKIAPWAQAQADLVRFMLCSRPYKAL